MAVRLAPESGGASLASSGGELSRRLSRFKRMLDSDLNRLIEHVAFSCFRTLNRDRNRYSRYDDIYSPPNADKRHLFPSYLAFDIRWSDDRAFGRFSLSPPRTLLSGTATTTFWRGFQAGSWRRPERSGKRSPSTSTKCSTTRTSALSFTTPIIDE